MPKPPLDVLLRYGCAVASVVLATVAFLALSPILGDRFPFVLFFVAIVLAAGYGGYGPSVVAVVLSWLAVDTFFLAGRASTSVFDSKAEIAFAFLSLVFAISVLGGSLRAAHERAMVGSSELRRTLEVQQAEQEWLRITFASIADAVITTDPHGLVRFLNPVAARLTGWPLDEALGHTLKEVFRTVQEMSRRTREFPIARVVGDGEIIYSSDQVMLVARDGTARSVEHNAAPIKDAHGKIKGAVIVFRDITERQRVEQAQRESEERFRKLADATPVLIWGSDKNKACNYFNKQWLEFTGRTIEQEMGDGWTQSVHPDDLERCLGTYVSAFDSRTSFTMEYRLRRRDGEYRWVLDNGVARFAPDGTFSGYIGSCVDITDRKQAEEELRKSDRRKEEFLAVLSHELRNPLAPIQTAVDLLEQRSTEANGATRELAMIKRQVLNLTRLVDDLMDISRISRGKIELRKRVVDLVTLAAESVEAVRPRLDEHLQDLRVILPVSPIFVEADPTRLDQILSNLLLNASKYTPRGGQIDLEVETSQNKVVIRVRDTGIGIDSSLLPKVFDLFLQGERRAGLSHEGGGIGLSLAKNLVELHGGTITAHSKGPDQGSEFVLRLPTTSRMGPDRETLSQTARIASVDSLPRRVLIVDDNVQAADSLGRLMTAVFGLDARVVYNGHAALELAGSFLPEIVLLDLEMTGMDGYEVAMRLRERADCAGAQIVAVTGWGHEEDRRRSLEMGFDLHLVKPVTAQVLRALLADLDGKLEPQYQPEFFADLVSGTSVGSIEETCPGPND